MNKSPCARCDYWYDFATMHIRGNKLYCNGCCYSNLTILEYEVQNKQLIKRVEKQDTRINNLTFELAVSRTQNKRYREKLEEIEQAKYKYCGNEYPYEVNKIVCEVLESEL